MRGAHSRRFKHRGQHSLAELLLFSKQLDILASAAGVEAIHLDEHGTCETVRYSNTELVSGAIWINDAKEDLVPGLVG
jgi:hypothetical protein